MIHVKDSLLPWGIDIIRYQMVCFKSSCIQTSRFKSLPKHFVDIVLMPGRHQHACKFWHASARTCGHSAHFAGCGMQSSTEGAAKRCAVPGQLRKFWSEKQMWVVWNEMKYCKLKIWRQRIHRIIGWENKHRLSDWIRLETGVGMTSGSTHQEHAPVLATSTASTMSLAHDVVRPLFLGNLQYASEFWLWDIMWYDSRVAVYGWLPKMKVKA